MKPASRFATAIAGCAALVALALAAGCSKQPTGVDPSFNTPEGSPTPSARLVLWSALPVTSLVYRDKPPIGPGPEDELAGANEYRTHPDNSVVGMVLDNTSATNYQVLRRSANGGLTPIAEYLLNPTRRWLDTHWEVYEFSDTAPPAVPDYIGRGLVAGSINAASPLTNEATLGARAVPNLPLRFPTDSTLIWDPVPNAAYYVCHIFQFRNAATQDQILAAAPAPFYRGLSLDYLLGFVTAPQIFGLNVPIHGTILTQRYQPPGGYFAQVSAVDANGGLLAYSYGDTVAATSTLTYERYASGSVLLKRPATGGGGGGPGPGRASLVGAPIHRRRH